jgi:tetratricopeptide (TPR) repeat protein
MIVKDEEATLPACLASIADLVAEVIVVDTGSADRTRDVAAARGTRVIDFAWCDDFAAARNESLRHATGDWILWLDADERLDDANRDRLKAVLDALPDGPAAYSMRQRSPAPGGAAATVVDQVRLFRRDPAVGWEYRVHEQLLPSLRRAGYVVHGTDIVIEHAGYQDPALARRKLRRNLRLLLLDQQQRPDDAFVLFNLGWAYLELGRDIEAIPFLQRSLQQSQPGDSIVPKLYALLAQAERRRGRWAEALAACHAGRVCRPDDAELLVLEGDLQRQQGNNAAAELIWRQLTEATTAEGAGCAGPEGWSSAFRRSGSQPPEGGTPTDMGVRFGSAAEGLGGRQARHRLALLYREQGRADEAEAQWQGALAEDWAFLPAWLGLGELYLAAGRWPELERIVHELGNGLQRPADAPMPMNPH